MINLNPKPTKVQFTKEELIYFNNYLTHAQAQNCFLSGNEHFFIWHYNEIVSRIMNKIFSLLHDHADKKIKISFNQAERRTMSVIFNRVPSDSYILPIENRILTGLYTLPQ